MEMIISSCYDYLKEQLRWQTGMKKELARLRENHPKIKAVLDFASTQANIKCEHLKKWRSQLIGYNDKAEGLLDVFEHEEQQQITNYMEKTKKRKFTDSLSDFGRKIRKVGERLLKIDPNLNRLEEVVQKLDQVSAELNTFLLLLACTKREQQKQELELYQSQVSAEEKGFVINWLKKKPLNEEPETGRYRSISLLFIVARPGMGKTTLAQYVFEDIPEKEFREMCAYASNNFDVKRVIRNMLESLYKNKIDLDILDARQVILKSALKSKKFLLVLDDIWEKEEDRDNSKWGNVLASLAYGSLGSKILMTTRMDSVTLMIAKTIEKKRIELLEL